MAVDFLQYARHKHTLNAYCTYTHTGTYPHWQVGPEVDYEDGKGLPPVIDGVDEVQTLFFLSIQHTKQS